MLEICLLGTGAMMPLPDRRLASMMVRVNGKQLLIDCGEGTQVAAREAGWSLARIDAIGITHFHADHTAGLPGLLLTMGSSGRTEPVVIIGPAGITYVVSCLRIIAPELPYKIEFVELHEPLHTIPFHGARLTCFAVSHMIPCYGYTVELDRPGKFDKARAEALGIPVAYWNRLQNGETIAADAGALTPDMVLGPPRKGLKVAYSTDTRPVEAIAHNAEDADLLICEGTYGEDDKAQKAWGYGHMTFSDAAGLAKRARAKQLLLTHFSPSMQHPEEYIENARRIFEHTGVGYDGLFKTLRFE